MAIKLKDAERFSVTMTRNWENVMESWVKKKHASVVATQLLAWSCKLHGNVVLPSFAAEDEFIKHMNESFKCI